MNTIFIFDLQKNNNCNNMGFRMQKSTYDMLSVSTKSKTIFIWLSKVLTKPSKLWAWSIEKLVQSLYVFSQSTNK
jgi:hypothetical protein